MDRKSRMSAQRRQTIFTRKQTLKDLQMRKNSEIIIEVVNRLLPVLQDEIKRQVEAALADHAAEGGVS